MSYETLNASVRTRVPKKIRTRLEEIAIARHLDLSDIIREALRVYLDSANRKKAA